MQGLYVLYASALVDAHAGIQLPELNKANACNRVCVTVCVCVCVCVYVCMCVNSFSTRTVLAY